MSTTPSVSDLKQHQPKGQSGDGAALSALTPGEQGLHQYPDDSAGGWSDRMTPRDLAALSPLITQHVNPYGRFELDMETRLQLAA